MAILIQNPSSSGQNDGNLRQDVFNEVLVRQRWGMPDYARLAMISAATVLVFFLMLLFIQYIFTLLPILVAGLLFGIYYLIKHLRKEYEYIATNGSIDIDCITAKSRRKRVLSLNPQDIDEVAPLEDCETIRSKAQKVKVLDCSSRNKDAEIWCVCGKYKEKYLVAMIDGHDKILNNLRRFSPNKVKRRSVKP